MVNRDEYFQLVDKLRKTTLTEIGVNKENKEYETLIDDGIISYNDLLSCFESKDKYNLHYAFKRAYKVLEKLFLSNEFLLSTIELRKDDDEIKIIDANVNSHVVLEMKKSYRSVKWMFEMFKFIELLTTFILVYSITTFSIQFEHGFPALAPIIVIIAAITKVFLDKRFLDPYLEVKGWELYRKSLNRSFAFYFASILLIEKIDGKANYYYSSKDKLKNLTRVTIDMLLVGLNTYY